MQRKCPSVVLYMDRLPYGSNGIKIATMAFLRLAGLNIGGTSRRTYHADIKCRTKVDRRTRSGIGICRDEG
jgi:hypothetical protein